MNSKSLGFSAYESMFKPSDVSQSDQVRNLKIKNLHPFKRHPFKVLADSKMQELIESIKENGVLSPVIVRPDPSGGHELISGHRRTHACTLAGFDTIPAIIREIDDDEATIIMVDSNYQRESLLPSEKAFAYKMKMEALNRQGQRSGTCRQVVDKLKSADIIGESAGESGRQIQRYIRLTFLIQPLLDLADAKKLAINAGVKLSYLTEQEQAWVEESGVIPSIGQSNLLLQESQQGLLTEELLYIILDTKPARDFKFTLKGKQIRQYFPSEYSEQDMEQVIISLLEDWRNNRDV